MKRSPDGSLYIAVAPSLEEEPDALRKSLKTSYSKRNFPLHPHLVEVGFLEFLKIRQTDGQSPRLFKGLKRGGNGYFSEYPTRRFREVFLPEAIQVEDGQTLYSFRHSFRDALRRMEAPDDVVGALGGWSLGKKVSDNYGDAKDPTYLSRYVSRVEYPGLKLDFRYRSLD